ncbi:MAG: preprotein translocase subunit SecG [Gammaproteobacteria bacterium]|nr:preprotein translocase subunit SecG [Gammaproteobacteria bacterium]
MQSFLLVVQVLISISLIALILIQHGKGADAGAAFGSGASSTVFGASGSASFLSRATAVLATLFFAVALSLTILAHRQTSEDNLVDKYKMPESSAVAPSKETPKSDVPVVSKPKQSDSDVPAIPAASRKADLPVTDKPVSENKDK